MEDLGTLCYYDNDGNVVFESISRYCYADWPKEKNIHKGLIYDQGHYVGVIFDSNTKEFTECPYVWENIKFISIYKCEPHPKYPNYDHGCTFSATIEISSDGKVFEPVPHTLICRNGLDFFLDTIVRYINTYISKTKSIEGINWEYLDNIGLEWNCDSANGQSHLHNKQDIRVKYAELIYDMHWTRYNHYVPQRGRLYEKEWDTYKVEFTSNDYDSYLVSLIKTALQKYYKVVRYNEMNFHLSTDRNASFSDHICEENSNYRDDKLILRIIVYVISHYNETDRIIKLLSK